mmetsp:Transcript_69068/g.179415  ORF Transcript_69068/g.179415 Transcript_69068/m.179415 type:complete len:1273 (-) Transcript_69068:209-4027(-)
MPPLDNIGDSGSVGSQSVQGSVDHHGDGVGLLQGEDALAALVLVLCQALQNDKSLKKWSAVGDLPAFVAQVRTFLSGVFDGEWPSMYVTPDVVEGPQFDGLVNVMLDIAHEKTASQDVLVAAMETICHTKMGDRRVLRFFARVREFQHTAEAGGAFPTTAESGSENIEDIRAVDRVADEAIASELNGAEDGSINVQSLEELVMPPSMVKEAQTAWAQFISAAKSREAAGEMIYGALFDSAPSLQALFTTPRAVQAMRFMNGLTSFVTSLNEPAKLKILVETLGFGHLHLEVTVPRVVIFRDAILDLLSAELGAKLTSEALEGWRALLNYVGGAIIFCKAHYAARVSLLLRSWKLANEKSSQQVQMETTEAKEEEPYSGEVGAAAETALEDAPAQKKQGRWRRMMRQRTSPNTAADEGLANSAGGGGSSGEAVGSPRATDSDGSRTLKSGQYVPTTFPEMFVWNAGVVGLRNVQWHKEVLSSFDNIVQNVANSARLQEECEALVLRISKCSKDDVKLSEFKSCMLAALRQLQPKTWDSSYEVAWTWLWENVERLLVKNIGQPPVWENELGKVMGCLDDNEMYRIRRDIYERFFQLCPAGQDYFKQSNTRLHYIATKVIEMTLNIFQDPWAVVEEISALGLRHVGYGIPTEHIAPFVTASIEVFSGATDNNHALEAFRWSLGLVSKILVRTILEGSTIVMKAVNANSQKLLQKAISCAPRAKRAEWMLKIQVGTQTISPLYWAIQSGNLDAADAMIKDLLTIRADRERYYYGVDALFERHEDFVARLVDEARVLLPTLFDGLVWRSRHTKDGLRRVNYYIKHLVVSGSGSLADALRPLTASKDQTIISHPVICLVSDTLWSGVVKRQFILSKIGFLFSLLVFMLSQAILPKLGIQHSRGLRFAILIGRAVNYLFSMTRMIAFHVRRSCGAYRNGRLVKVFRIPFPAYLRNFYLLLGFILTLLLMAMCAHEPMFYCIGETADWPTEDCDDASSVQGRYTIFSMIAMFIHWLLLIDMAVFAHKLSAFVLVVKHVLSEVGRFCVAMLFLLITFSSAAACLRHDKREFRDLPSAANCLFAITVGLFEGDFREYFDAPFLLMCIFFFVTVSAILLINLLIAQLNCSYEYVYADMVGFARLTRASLIADMLQACPPMRWSRFVATLRFDQRVEFDEGDVGLSGALQVKEPASLNPVMVDSINRYGGTCSPDMQWPAEQGQDEEDRFERIERLMQTALAKLSKTDKRHESAGIDSKNTTGPSGLSDEEEEAGISSGSSDAA